jgi:peptide/nickel transport system permease protein
MNRRASAYQLVARRVGFTGLALMVFAALLGMLYTPYDPLHLDIVRRLQPPSGGHWFGTDQFGRDVLSRVLTGAAVSLRVSLATVAFAAIAGVILGALAGYFRGWVDRVIGVFVDAFLALPGILLALVLIALVGTGETGVVIALGMAYAPSIARVVRASVLSIREQAYVEAARLFGHPQWYVICRHVVPNVAGPLTVLVTGYYAQALLAESTLSFLGLGVPPPHPSWGGILAEGQAFLADAPWLSVFPGLAIVVSLLCINLVGDALRDRLDPRKR